MPIGWFNRMTVRVGGKHLIQIFVCGMNGPPSTLLLFSFLFKEGKLLQLIWQLLGYLNKIR